MGRWRLLALAVAALFACPRLVSAGEVNVAVVNVNTVFAEYYRVAETEEEFTRFQAERTTELEKQREELAEMEARLQTQQLLLSEAEKEKLAAEIQEKQRTLTRQFQRVREELQEKNLELVEARVDEIQAVITALGQERGFALVINKEAVLYAPEAADITRLVIEELNRPAQDSN